MSLRVALAGLLAMGLLGPLGAAPARAAEDELFLASRASYAIDPEAGVVHVVVDVTATNRKPDLVQPTAGGTRTTRYFYEGASLLVQPEATRIRATAGRLGLTVTTRPREGFVVVDVRFRRDLQFGESTDFRVEYDLPGGAPRSASEIRVGSAFATFPAWAFGDRGEVRIAIPSTFRDQTSGARLESSVADGVTTLSATDIADVAGWYVRVVADRHEALTRDTVSLAGGRDVVVRAWPEDAQWRQRVGDLLRIGLPELARRIGLAWPVARELEVAEVHTPLLEGYAGVFYSGENRIEISEELDELTILHEASHAWFNGALFEGRWINEGLADEYAARVLDDVSVGGLAPEPVSRDDPAAVPLDQWLHPGRIADAETAAREHYGYEASWRVIRDLVAEVGEEGMRDVFAAADAGLTAYAGAGPREPVFGPADWRRFLDLLEEVGGSTTAEPLFRRWVVAPWQVEILGERLTVRAAYAALVEAGAGWRPGFPIRDRMARWDFVGANLQIGRARAVLATRDEIAAVAGRLGLRPPVSVRRAYEGSATLERVAELAAEQLAALAALDAAGRAVAAERDPFASLGLLGEDPAAALAAARADFEADRMAATGAAAAEVSALVAGAAETGRGRALAGGGIGGALAVAGAGVAIALRRRRRAAFESATAAPTAIAAGLAATGDEPSALAGVPAGADPYATLGPPHPEAAADERPAGPERGGGDGT